MSTFTESWTTRTRAVLIEVDDGDVSADGGQPKRACSAHLRLFVCAGSSRGMNTGKRKESAGYKKCKGVKC
jgi:hypothetical protein